MNDKYSIVDQFYKSVQEGKEGLNTGIPFTVTGLNDVVGGIMKDNYYLIMGKSKTGKSAFMYTEFIFNIALSIVRGELKEEDFIIELYTLEIGIVKVLAKAAGWYIYMTRGSEISVKAILGYRGPAASGVYALVEGDEVRKFLRTIERVVKVHTTLSPVKLFNYITPKLKGLSLKIGVDSEGSDIYRFKNPSLNYLLLVDHVSLAEGGKNTKDTIDTVSGLLRRYRNAFGLITALVQQITPTKGADGVKYTYGHEDARDSKDTFQDCDICLSIGSPFHDKIKSVQYKGGIYQVLPTLANGNIGLKDTLRLISVEKDRNGSSSTLLSSRFAGAVGHFMDIPLPEDIEYEVE